MFEVGFSEMLLIALVALLVLGPNKLPKLARDVGRWAGRAWRWREVSATAPRARRGAYHQA
jgi:Tat protein translocase TatB subunit